MGGVLNQPEAVQNRVGAKLAQRACRIDADDCSIGGRIRRFLCDTHYKRWQRYGDPLHVPVQPRPPRGEAHPRWKGWNDLSYGGQHDRVERERGFASRCSIFQCSTGSTHYEWANISGQYKDVGDFIEMCKIHHAAHDAEISKRKELITL
jgi:hypothetical protein